MQLRQRYTASEEGRRPNRGTKRARSQGKGAGNSTTSPNNALRSPATGKTTRPGPNYVRFEKAINLTYIASGVADQRSLRSGVALRSEHALNTGVKEKACRKHGPRKPKAGRNAIAKTLPSGGRKDQTGQIGNFGDRTVCLVGRISKKKFVIHL